MISTAIGAATKLNNYVTIQDIKITLIYKHNQNLLYFKNHRVHFESLFSQELITRLTMDQAVPYALLPLKYRVALFNEL